ncbi:MAG: antitoxin [Actinomycetaceae bacterium]|nr:antitoxin [Actinomycetaceae bacterium]
MSAITVRKLPEETKQRLRVRAAVKGRSMEAEARDILVKELSGTGSNTEWIDQIIAASAEYGGTDLDIPARDDQASYVDFTADPPDVKRS